MPSIFYLILLWATLGYPKIPGSSLPIALIVILALIPAWHKLPSYWNGLVLHQVIASGLFFIYCMIRILCSEHNSPEEWAFIFALLYKGIISASVCLCVCELIKSGKNMMALTIIAQTMMIIGSAYSQDVYSALLLFQSPSATEVFSQTFGLRSMGFGMIHNEGAVFLICLFILLSEFGSISHTLRFTLGISLYGAAAMSRLLLVLLPVWQLIRDCTSLMVIGAIIGFSLVYLDTTVGILSQVFEVFNNAMEGNGLTTTSSRAIENMVVLPEGPTAWIYGEGAFLAPDGFYMGTDIGFCRVLLFGGIPALVLFGYVSLWPLLAMRSSSQSGPSTNHWFTIAFLLYCFLASNLKGIVVQPWTFAACMILINYEKSKFSNLSRHDK